MYYSGMQLAMLSEDVVKKFRQRVSHFWMGHPYPFTQKIIVELQNILYLRYSITLIDSIPSTHFSQPEFYLLFCDIQ